MNGPTRLEGVLSHRIVPVLALSDASRAQDLAAAMVEGNLPIAEVTFRNECAAQTMRTMADNPQMLVGAGTVITAEQVNIAADSGAQFIVSPGISRDVIERSQELGLPVLPGAVTPSEIMEALSLGLTAVKFFPASVYGGVTAISALAGPFNQVRFLPTGGINVTNMNDYLSKPFIPAVGGSWMLPSADIDAGNFEAVKNLCLQATQSVALTPGAGS